MTVTHWSLMGSSGRDNHGQLIGFTHGNHHLRCHSGTSAHPRVFPRMGPTATAIAAPGNASTAATATCMTTTGGLDPTLLTRYHPWRVHGCWGPTQRETSVWAQGRGCAQTGALKGVHNAVRPPGYPKPLVLTVRIFTPVACVEDVEAPPPSNFWPQARSVTSQCRQARHQVTFRKSTTRVRLACGRISIPRSQ